MSYSYIITSISLLPVGYRCLFDPPLGGLAKQIIGGDADVEWTIRIRHEGEQLEETTRLLKFRNGKISGGDLTPFIREASSDLLSVDKPGYFENSLAIASGEPLFKDRKPLSFYTCYSAENRKSFLSDHAYKVASPPTIDQVAQYGAYTDNYSATWIDKSKDMDESIVLINSYDMPLVVTLKTSDGRTLPRKSVPSGSARLIRLRDLLQDGEESWQGRVQITATNRVITYDMRHSYADPSNISDYEHLDPFRADPTHLPAFQNLRFKVGRYLQQHGIDR